MKRLILLLVFLAAASAHADRLVRGGVTIIREDVMTTRLGSEIGTLKVYLPSGFNVAIDPFSRRAHPFATFTKVPVPAGRDLPLTLQIDRTKLAPGAATGPIYPLPDRIPVRFQTESITWTIDTGSFAFDATVELQYRDELQMLALQAGIIRDLPGARPAASNSLYYLACKNGNPRYEFRARADGAATLHSLDIALDPYKFGAQALEFQTHFPETTVSWEQAADSRIRFTNDEISRSTSGLSDADPFLVSYARGIEPKGCEGADPPPKIPLGLIACRPDGNRLRFTRDGGLHAECDLFQADDQTGASLQWMGYQQGEEGEEELFFASHS